MLVSVTEAARIVGCARSTLYDKINSGQLSRSAGGKIDVSELQRVFGELQTPAPQQHDDKPDTALHAQPDVVLSTELLDMVQAKDSELSELRAELDDTRQRLTEHREAARALIDPETFEAKQAELKAEIQRIKTESDNKLQQQQTAQVEKENQWQAAIAERQAEIKAAREQADEIRQREADAIARAAEVEQRAEREIKAMQNRGLIDRLLNRQPTTE